ncbi:MAG: RNA polymerase factor sigma-54 [Kiritimatiellae bacterium]|nr:RNA polymerase factor sigma-54 [Kiritimatiellia bacterium]
MANQGFSLSQQQRQTMTIAPQMRQSLEMLQKPILELRQMIHDEMAVNPLLEEVVDPSEFRESDDAHLADEQAFTDDGQPYDSDIDGGADPYELQTGKSFEEDEQQDRELDFDPDIDAVLREDDEMRDYALQGMENGIDLEDVENKRQYLFDNIRERESLQDHLLKQLPLTNLSEKDRELAVTLIGNINDDGYFTGSLPDIEMVSERSEAEILRVLSVIQTFDPPGVGARSLRECLLLQLDQEKENRPPCAKKARELIDRYLPQLGRREDSFLCKTLGLLRSELEAIRSFILTLNPRPGSSFVASDTEYVEPEVTVVRDANGRFIARVENAFIPEIRISRRYRNLLEDGATPAKTKAYIRERLRAGLYLIHGIEQRQDTIRKIAQAIVDAQIPFMTQGVKALRPMTMLEVATVVGVHETTVSRTVANKYIRTPCGVFLMKYFFSAGLKHEDGESVSNRSVQNLVAEMVRNENPSKPLSDQAIEAMLKEKGITCARRTIAKYRGILKIPPSHERRRN